MEPAACSRNASQARRARGAAGPPSSPAAPPRARVLRRAILLSRAEGDEAPVWRLSPVCQPDGGPAPGRGRGAARPEVRRLVRLPSASAAGPARPPPQIPEGEVARWGDTQVTPRPCVTRREEEHRHRGGPAHVTVRQAPGQDPGLHSAAALAYVNDGWRPGSQSRHFNMKSRYATAPRSERLKWDRFKETQLLMRR